MERGSRYPSSIHFHNQKHRTVQKLMKNIFSCNFGVLSTTCSFSSTVTVNGSLLSLPLVVIISKQWGGGLSSRQFPSNMYVEPLSKRTKAANKSSTLKRAFTSGGGRGPRFPGNNLLIEALTETGLGEPPTQIARSNACISVEARTPPAELARYIVRPPPRWIDVTSPSFTKYRSPDFA